MVEKRIFSSQRELIAFRREFGKGRAGSLAFRAIAGGIGCEAILDDRGNRCQVPADRTVDFTVLGSDDFVPSCFSHKELIEKRILADLEEQGRSTVIGRNGRGRA